MKEKDTTPRVPLSEAMIQAEIYHQLRLRKIKVALELTVPHGRLDVAIFNHECTHVTGIIEVKKSDVPLKNSRQIRRYESIGLPFMVVNRFNLMKSISWAESLTGGMLLSDILSLEVPIEHRRFRKPPRIGGRNSYPVDRYLDEDLNFKE